MQDKEYRLEVRPEQKTELLCQQLDKLKKRLEDNTVKNEEVIILPPKFKAVLFDKHLYQTLLSYTLKKGEKQEIPVSTVALHESETEFLNAIMKYCNQQPQELQGC